MGGKNDIGRVLANLPIFQHVRDSEMATLVSGTHEVRLVKGQMLFPRGTLLNGFYIVVCGQVKLAFSSPKGNEKVVRIVGHRQSFGEAAMFAEHPTPVLAQALEDSYLLHVSKQTLFSAMDSDSAFARRMIIGLSIRVHQLIQEIEDHTLRSSTDRVVRFLLQWATPPSHTPIEFDIPVSKHIIASRLGVAPETLSRVLHHLVEAGLIAIQGKHVTVLDVERLSRLDEE